MARRSNGDTSTDALELFLDAISNTFGAVLFIAMIVSIMLSMSGPPTLPTVDPRLEAEIRASLDQVAQENEQLESLVAQLELAIDESTASLDEKLGEQYRKHTAEKQNLQAKLVSKKRNHAKLDKEIKKLERSLAQKKKERRQLDARQAAAISKSKELSKKTPNQIRLPQAKQAATLEIIVLVARDRLTFALKYGGRSALSFNKADNDIKQIGKYVSFHPRPNKGIHVEGTDAFKTALSHALGQF